MKKTIILVMFMTMLLCISGCKAKEDTGNSGTATISIVEEHWDDLGGVEYNSQDYNVKLGDKISYITGQEFTVNYIQDDYIVLVSNYPLSPSIEDSGLINMRSDQTEFKINKGETWYLTTLSYDGGETYAVTY